MWIHIQWGFSKVTGPECHSECTDSKPKLFFFESFYFLSFIFLRWIATCTGTHNITWWKVELTHFVPAVGFDPRLYWFVVWGVIHWTTVRWCECSSLWLILRIEDPAQALISNLYQLRYFNEISYPGIFKGTDYESVVKFTKDVQPRDVLARFSLH